MGTLTLKYLENEKKSMGLKPRQVAFLKDEMEKIEKDDSRQPTARKEAEEIKKIARQKLTE